MAKHSSHNPGKPRRLSLKGRLFEVGAPGSVLPGVFVNNIHILMCLCIVFSQLYGNFDWQSKETFPRRELRV